MSQEDTQKAPERGGSETDRKSQIGRRDILKALVSVPVFGAFFYALIAKKSGDIHKKKQILAELGLGEGGPAVLPGAVSKKPANHIRLGIIGFGGRGEDIIRAAGFAHPDWVESRRTAAEENKFDRGLDDWLRQEDLNLSLTAVCDLFDVRAERGLAVSKNEIGPGVGSRTLTGARRYRHYQELLASGDVDAVVIATPDHWHAQMIIDAVNAGVHVYCEKCMTRTEGEVYDVAAAVKRSGMVFQLGHQNRHQETYIRARELVKRNIMGPITLVESTTNRNSPGGAWIYDIHKEGSPETIEWDQFQEAAPHHVPFSLERFFRWRCWYDYGTGLSGDLLSHEFDAVNQILSLGIPHTAVASGGIYYYKDGRDVPDVFQVVFEYPHRNLTLMYSATLANGRNRGKLFMGHDATMEVGELLTVTADGESTRYKEKIESGVIDTSLPLFSYQPGSKGIDAVTSPTEKYFASRGLMYTYRDGRRVDVTHLHVKDWLGCIRNGGQPACNIERGFEEAITCHMATKSYLEGRMVTWDPVGKRII